MSKEWVCGWRGIQRGTLEGEAKKFDVNVEEELMHGTPCCGISLVRLVCLAMMIQTVCSSKMSVTTSQTTWFHNPKDSLNHLPLCLLQMMLILGGIAVVILVIIIGKLESRIYFYNCSLPDAVSCRTNRFLQQVFAVGHIKQCLLSWWLEPLR